MVQHDAQELSCLLFSELESLLKVKSIEKLEKMNKMFEGYAINFISCLNVN